MSAGSPDDEFFCTDLCQSMFLLTPDEITSLSRKFFFTLLDRSTDSGPGWPCPWPQHQMVWRATKTNVSCKRCTHRSTHRSSLACTCIFTAFRLKHTVCAIGWQTNTSTLTRLSRSPKDGSGKVRFTPTSLHLVRVAFISRCRQYTSADSIR